MYGLFRRWQRAGVWRRMLTVLQARADADGSIVWDRARPPRAGAVAGRLPAVRAGDRGHPGAASGRRRARTRPDRVLADASPRSRRWRRA
ncbi:hypothetical protein [Saccharothrix espanaensis]|uniref:hypothetical protein n=1 Tax=Saccharothrix espanaensis TaxID=103731 RepID=UPI001E364B97|nr:hypothetical protein [Saccharothrix espanaensis]